MEKLHIEYEVVFCKTFQFSKILSLFQKVTQRLIRTSLDALAVCLVGLPSDRPRDIVHLVSMRHQGSDESAVAISEPP